jgi:hypothetical protein
MKRPVTKRAVLRDPDFGEGHAGCRRRTSWRRRSGRAKLAPMDKSDPIDFRITEKPPLDPGLDRTEETLSRRPEKAAPAHREGPPLAHSPPPPVSLERATAPGIHPIQRPDWAKRASGRPTSVPSASFCRLQVPTINEQCGRGPTKRAAKIYQEDHRLD